MIRRALVLLAATGAVAHADGVTCTKVAQHKARAAADKAVKAKDYKGAIAILSPYSTCQWDGDHDSIVENAWLTGELAVAYEKDGQPVECSRAVWPLFDRARGLVGDDKNDKLLKALGYNGDQCSKDWEAHLAALTSPACPLALGNDLRGAGIALPAALAPKGAGAACLALVGPDRPDVPIHHGADGNAEDQVVVTCPLVTMFWKDAAGKLERRALVSKGDPDRLTDQSFCCALGQLAIGTLDGKTTVRVQGSGRECNNGDAEMNLDVLYELSGSGLMVTQDASIGLR